MLVPLISLLGLVMGPSQVEHDIAMLDLTKAVVFAPADLPPREKQAVTMLVEEVEKRSGIRWSVVDRPPNGSAFITISASRPDPATKAEGYRIKTDSSRRSVSIEGHDSRGVLFGVGRLLRELRMSRNRVVVPSSFAVVSSPTTALRGHQLGYRPKTNSYDGWDLDQWERYLRDLVVFGTNAIELIPPRSDDDADSPHFPRPPMEMMVGMSKLADRYGIDVWIWYPAMDKDYADPSTVDFAIKEWAEVFQRLPRIDAVFVPGGDPGHTRPKTLLALLEKQSESLHRFHPRAQVWVSPQSFNAEWHDEFLSLLKSEPAWLAGVVFGPQVRVGLTELRRTVPARYPIRNYPDITHTLKCQYPVPDWDLAFALTQDREVINPRPLGQASIFRACRDQTVGFLTYSEGCNDDVNKFVWSGLGWNDETPVIEILRHYGRYFIGERQADGFAQGLLALEQNWRGPLLTNSGVETTVRQFEDMARDAGPEVLLNWRFQQALYRANYDAYLRDRLIYETRLEAEAMEALRDARRSGSLHALRRAEVVLNRAVDQPVALDRRARVHELADAMFQSIRMQTSVPRHRAIEIGRGTHLDTIDVPLNDRLWLEEQFASIRGIGQESDRQRAIQAITARTDPGPGGFYDNLGDVSRQPHLVHGASFEVSPDFRESALVGFGRRPDWPMAWCRNAQSLYDNPLSVHYTRLDPEATYRVRVVYAGDSLKTKIRLDAEGTEVHPLIEKPDPVRPLEFDLPHAATADGSLTLRWSPEMGRGGNGRGNQVAEVWLIRRDR